MSITRLFYALRLYLRYIPWVDSPEWTEDDAEALQEYMKSTSGKKLRLYMRNYVLRQQSEAVSSISNLEYQSGLCNGSKSVLVQLDMLAETENFTAEDAEGS